MTNRQGENQNFIAIKTHQSFFKRLLFTYKSVVFTLCLFLFSFTLFSQNSISNLEGNTLKSTVRLNYIPVSMPTAFDPNLKPTMGTFGLQYLISINDWLYGGVGMHAAITGDQGGLFTLGLTMGARKRIYKNLFVDANFHFGGGGGYRYLINDGAFINTNMGLSYQQKKYNIGVQYSYVNFYTGQVKSNSVSIFVEIPSVLRFTNYKESHKKFIATDFSKDHFWKKPAVKNVQQVRFDFFKPFGNSRKDNANNQEPLTETLYVLGFEYQKFISDNSFVFVHTDAIYKGLRAGFMDLFFGAGYYPYQTNTLKLFTKLGLGAAGGRVAPEGGLMIYPSAGLDYQFTNHLSLSSHLGYYRAIAGDLEAYTFGFGVKYIADSGGTDNFKEFRTQGMRIALQNQSYFDVAKTDSDPVRLELLALQANYALNKSFYLIGEVGFAYAGKSGGYAQGLVGLGVYSPAFLKNKLRVQLEGLIGAAGGAGVDTGEGIILKPTLGLSYALNDVISINSSAGKMIAMSGAVNSTTVNIGLSFGFASLSSKK
ncbi:hypothetical protein GCM10011416_22210 [Polaribacter pacificus]|uniref:Uncharacterized protein n=1 Tax=Polaribacter pacificus TaxID=1775173 RepID=A0A917MFI0_9FLAO|nr:hypothetical protein [Polaribacter pacificus]GGH02923.1 hypothetical protein GCM10011416_22210 [Polaribacter pacificus]